MSFLNKVVLSELYGIERCISNIVVSIKFLVLSELYGIERKLIMGIYVLMLALVLSELYGIESFECYYTGSRQRRQFYLNYMG